MDDNDESIEKVLQIASRGCFFIDDGEVREAIKDLNRLEIAALTQVICSRVEIQLIRALRSRQQEAEKLAKQAPEVL